MSWLAVEKSLLAQLKSGDLGYPIIIENQPENASASATPRLETTNLLAPTETLDKCLAQRYNGIYQISIFVDADTGKNTLLTIIDNVLELYTVNELPELDNCTVSIDSRSQNTSRRDGKFYRCDISINYFALIGRA